MGAIAAAASHAEIGTVIDDAMRSIEKENKRLKDIFLRTLPSELDKRRLGEVVDLFTNIQMIEHGNSKDIIGRTYEYCSSKFANRKASLPVSSILPLVLCVHLLKYCSRSMGVFMTHAAALADVRSVRKIHRKPRRQHQQDFRLWSGLQQTTWKMAQMNLAIRGIEPTSASLNADTFFNDCHLSSRQTLFGKSAIQSLRLGRG